MRIKRLICWTSGDCEIALKFLTRCQLIANDIETFPYRKKNKIRNFTMTVNAYTGLHEDGSIRSFAFPFQTSKHPASNAPVHIDSIYHTCREINDLSIPFTGHNYVYDLSWHLRYLMPVRNWMFDSMIMWWAKYPELPKTLDFVSSILLDHYQYWKQGRKEEDYIEYMNYAMSDTESTLFNTIILIQWMLDDEKMRKNFFRAYTRSVTGLSMSMKGLRVNLKTMSKYNEELTESADKALDRVRYILADPEFNPNSPKQKKELIYGLLGIRFRNDKGKFVAKESDASAGATVLRAMRSDHPLFRYIANAILEAIEPAKQISNVVGLQFLPTQNPDTPRFLYSYDGVGTTTTRYSSRAHSFGHGGNGQNVRKDYRGFAEADKDSFLIEVDFSAADDVFVSYESQEPKKIELVESGKDIHATNALIFFSNWTYESVVAGKKAKDPKVVHPITGIRQITKKLVHGNHYLMAGLTLLMTAGREAVVAAAKENGYEDAGIWNQDKLVKFCEMLENLFRTHYPRFKRNGAGSWYEELKEEAARTRGFTTIFNYYQRFLGNPFDDATLRAIAATAGQANTAGRINMSLDELILGIRTTEFRDGQAPDWDDPTRVIGEESHGVSLRMQTHDSNLFNVRYTHPNWKEGVDSIFHVMNRPVVCKNRIIRVGIEADVSFRWGGKESITVNNANEIEELFLNRFDREKVCA